MFKARHSNLVVTQYEHLKLAGALALLWGNEEFEPPPCPFESFVKGVALHDRGYGAFDTLAIGEMSEHEWLDVSRKSFFDEYEDKLTDLIIKHHIFRLVSRADHQNAQALALVEQMRDSIAASIRDNKLDEKLFTFIDPITNLCDQISFDFCFQNYGAGCVAVQKRFAEHNLTPIKYTIEPGNTIKLSPYPLKVPHYQGYLLGYDSTHFPQKLEPTLLSYTITPF